MHPSSIENMKYFKEKYLNNLVEKNLNILDVGSQDINGNYKDIFQSKNWNYVGLDMQHGDNVDLIPNNEYKWDEIENESFHVVISGQALEHIEFFWLTIEEIYRVMKKSGFLCLIAPSSGYEHRHPVDCWRFLPRWHASNSKICRS